MEKGCRRVNAVKKCVYMYVNEKMVPVETTPEIRGREDEGEWLRR
jgi:hypothetical protein